MWTPQQHAIFDWFEKGDGNLVVQARAGAGKTSTTIEGVKRVPMHKRVLLLAFNKHSQKDLQAKLGLHTTRDVLTLHALGLRIIKEQLGPHVKVNDRRTKDIVYDMIPRNKNNWKIVQLVSRVKDAAPWATTVDEVIDTALRLNVLLDEKDMPASAQAEVCLKVLDACLRVTPEEGVDFADMVFLPYRKKWAPHDKYDLVCIDEAQDATPAQTEIALRSVKPNGRVVLIGDREQQLYAWRGAQVDGMDAMVKRLNAKELPLTVSFRCSKAVVAEARQLVPDIQALSTAPDGQVGELHVDEMVDEITTILADRKNTLSMFCLSRFNAPLFPLALRFLRNRVPFKIQGRDYGDRVLDVINKLKPSSEADLEIKLNSWKAMKLRSVQEDSKDPEIQRLISDVNDMVMGIRIVAAQRGVKDLAVAVEEMFNASSSRGVTLSTVHRIKGYEADIVFCLKETFVTRSSKFAKRLFCDDTENNIDYVATTRARLELFWVEGGVDEW